ncbi:jerky protein homolog-like [Ischnura elegans]|uniref:jerky protein homolog-like n=1 Tax=Ischnura elegans TaxID=197161 RepID=UPI001ED8B85B|nr:jerky protein homolog-like [Ischnura elegans]
MEYARNCDSGAGPSNRKTMNSASYEELDAAMLQWFTQRRAEGTPLSGPVVTDKAKFFYKQLGFEGEFNASSGWLTRFKNRHGIREISIQGERLSANNEAAVAFREEFQQFVTEERYDSSQIYNADETGLYWKCLPSKTLAFVQEKHAPGHKSSKERLTVMCCGNASGSHKLRLLVIGKSKRPRSFKGTEGSQLPVDYNQKGAWMDREIFEYWFHSKFVPQVRLFLKDKGLPPKAVLLLDNAPSHPN